MAGGTSKPFGFRPLRHLAGGQANRTNEFPIASAYNTSIGTGDPVKLLDDGTISQAAAGGRILGVFMGVDYVDASGNQVFSSRWIANTVATEIKARVISDPFVTFEVQSNKATAPDQTDVGLLADHVSAVPSAIHGGSGYYLNATQGTGVATWRILGLVDKPYNTGALYDTVEVAVVEHEYLPIFTGTPGV